MMVAGVDVGLDGAVALLDGSKFVLVADLPVHALKSGKTMKRAISAACANC
jgi:hypothetical protein